jgi:DNA replication and repair protein RecF
MISPKDTELIVEGSETRRKFIDGVISQLDSEYLDKLINYNKILAQRNALLKHFAETRSFVKESLSIWDFQLAQYGDYIFEKRKLFLDQFLPVLQHYHEIISSKKEIVSIEYESQLHHESFEALLEQSLNKDLYAQHTSVGIHKDDLSFNLGAFSIRKNGSQGQQKSLLVALKLAQFDYLKKTKKYSPILLLDDIFDKLDQGRVERLMQIVSSENFGQIFITDTHKLRMEGILSSIKADYKVFEIEQGKVISQ